MVVDCVSWARVVGQGGPELSVGNHGVPCATNLIGYHLHNSPNRNAQNLELEEFDESEEGLFFFLGQIRKVSAGKLMCFGHMLVFLQDVWDVRKVDIK